MATWRGTSTQGYRFNSQSEAEANQTIQPQPAATRRRAKHGQPVDCERLKRLKPQRSEVVEVRSSERSSGEMSEAACRPE